MPVALPAPLPRRADLEWESAGVVSVLVCHLHVSQAEFVIERVQQGLCESVGFLVQKLV
jgi:hypothetical protein